MLDDKLLDLKGLGTNDRADLTKMNALDGLVDHKRLGKQAEHAIQTDTRTIQKGRDGHDADIDQQQRATNLECGTAFEDHSEDVRAARRGADIKDDGAAERRQNHGKAQVEPHIARHRDTGRDKELKKRNIGGQRKRGEDAPQDCLALQKDKAQNDENRVDNPHKDADGQGREQRGQNDRHARGAAKSKVIRGFKRNDGKGRKNQTQIELGEKAREAWLLAALLAGTLAALDIGAIDHALHRHHGRTMQLLGSSRCRLCRGGLNRPCLAFCFALVSHYGNPSLTIWKQCAH